MIARAMWPSGMMAMASPGLSASILSANPGTADAAIRPLQQRLFSLYSWLPPCSGWSSTAGRLSTAYHTGDLLRGHALQTWLLERPRAFERGWTSSCRCLGVGRGVGVSTWFSRRNQSVRLPCASPTVSFCPGMSSPKRSARMRISAQSIWPKECLLRSRLTSSSLAEFSYSISFGMGLLSSGGTSLKTELAGCN